MSPRSHALRFRRLRLATAQMRRLRYRSRRRLTVFSGWMWAAAISLVGVEMFDILFGTFLLAPELFPVVIVGLAAAWYFRETLRSSWRWCRIRLRVYRSWRHWQR